MRTIEDLKKIAEENNWTLNPNRLVLERILQGQNKAKLDKGSYYCPCKVKKIDENICPCKDAKKEIAKTGHCHCNLFFRNDYYVALLNRRT